MLNTSIKDMPRKSWKQRLALAQHASTRQQSSKMTGEYDKRCTNSRYGMTRTGVTGAHWSSRLDHILSNGPVDQGGQGYCMNPASLTFRPKA